MKDMEKELKAMNDKEDNSFVKSKRREKIVINGRGEDEKVIKGGKRKRNQ